MAAVSRIFTTSNVGGRSTIPTWPERTATGATGNVKPGWTQQVGIIKTTLLLAVAVTASNLRQLLTWSRATGDVTDPLTLMEVRPSAFEEIDPSTGGVRATSPPTAA